VFLLKAADIEYTSETRQGEPLITFKSIDLPQEVEQSEILPLYVTFFVNDYIDKPLKLFLHLVDPNTGKLIVNADTDLDYPTDEWIPSESIRLGPYGIYIPDDLAEGEYNIRCGLMDVVFGDTKVTYLREPYSNQDIKDFVVATIKVIKSTAVERQKIEPLIITDFSTDVDANRWRTRGVVFNPENTSAKVTFFPGYRYPAFYMEDFSGDSEFLKDWSLYDFFAFEIEDLDDATKKGAPNLTLQIKDSQDRKYKLWLSPSEHYGKTVKVDIADIANYINIYDINYVGFYASNLTEARSFNFGSIKLLPGEEAVTPDDRPFITFDKLNAPTDVKAGKFFTFNMAVTISRHIKENYDMFVRLVDKNTSKDVLRIEVYPPLASTQWPVGQQTQIGEIRIPLSADIPEGDYYIKAGFYTTITIPEGAFYVKHYTIGDVIYTEQPSRGDMDFIRIPYTNTDVVDFIVGEIHISAADNPEQ